MGGPHGQPMRVPFVEVLGLVLFVSLLTASDWSGVERFGFHWLSGVEWRGVFLLTAGWVSELV